MKRRPKIILDILMLLIILTLFNKQFVSMKYHELAGLVLIALMILHIAINIKIAIAMCRKFLKVPVAIKVGLVVDILLLACFSGLGISGVMISRTVLTEISSGNMMFKLLHMFAGGMSVILLGVHIGLHVYHIHIPAIPAVLISAVILCTGAYGVAQSGEVRWLSMPFGVTAQPSGTENRGENSAFGVDGKQENKQEWAGHGEQTNSQNRQESGLQPLTGGGRQTSLSTVQRLQSIAMFAGMVLSCTVLTYWVVVIEKKKLSLRKN